MTFKTFLRFTLICFVIWATLCAVRKTSKAQTIYISGNHQIIDNSPDTIFCDAIEYEKPTGFVIKKTPYIYKEIILPIPALGYSPFQWFDSTKTKVYVRAYKQKGMWFFMKH